MNDFIRVNLTEIVNLQVLKQKIYIINQKVEVGGLKSLNPSNKKDGLKQILGIFSQNPMNDFIRINLTEIVNLQVLKQIIYIINQKVEKFLILVNILCLLFFNRHT